MNEALLQELLDAGCPAMLVVKVGAEMARLAEQSASLERRRAADRDRSQRRRDRSAEHNVNHVTSRDVADAADAIPPNDIYSNPPVLSPVPNGTGPLFSEIVVSTWNEMADANGLERARKLSPSRLKHLKARIREHSEEAVLEAIRKLGSSDWHCGRSTSGWCADLGWLLKSPENFQKILERSTVNGRHPLSPQPGSTDRASFAFALG